MPKLELVKAPTVDSSTFNLDIQTLDEWVPKAKASKEQQWLIDGFIPSDGITLISGQQKRARKTYFAMSAGIAITTGIHDAFRVKDVGPVLGVFEEGRDAPTASRFEQLCNAHSVAIPNNFHIAWRPRLKLNNPKHARELVNAVKRIQPKAVILDPLYRMVDGDENSQEDINAVVNTIFEVRALGPVVILLAHLDKARGETASKDIDQQIRGSSLIANMYDTHIALRKYKPRQKHIDVIVRDREGPECEYMLKWADDATFKLIKMGDDDD